MYEPLVYIFRILGVMVSIVVVITGMCFMLWACVLTCKEIRKELKK